MIDHILVTSKPVSFVCFLHYILKYFVLILKVILKVFLRVILKAFGI